MFDEPIDVDKRRISYAVVVSDKATPCPYCFFQMCLIQGSEFVNPNVYHQLMSEAHLCLRAELACNLPDQKKSNLKSAIRGSAAKMGDFFAR